MDYNNSRVEERPGRGLHRDDRRTLNLSIAAGMDLTPLIEFWGIHPRDREALLTQITQYNLNCSQNIMDTIESYKNLVPNDRDAFEEFFLSI